MLLLAAFAVAIYLIDLRGLWAVWGVEPIFRVASLVVDVIFVADLVLKLLVLRKNYLRSPWFVVDFISALPVIASLAHVPDLVHALRFLRGFRMFRILRTLRVLRTLPGMSGAVPLTRQTNTPEAKAYQRVLTASVLTYAATFVVLLAWIRIEAAPGQIVKLGGVDVHQKAELDIELIDEHGARGVIRLPADRIMGDPHEVEFFLVLGSLLGMALILVVVRFQLPDLWARQLRALLNVALPFQVAEHFMKNPDAYNVTVRMPATIIFCDLKGFTATVEALGGDLEKLKFHLERAMDVVVEVHRQEDLIVDKFIGDAIMSFRGGNLVDGTPKEHAQRVVRATVASMRALRDLDDPYFRAMKIGGASAESALIGTFGTSNRLSYTILGDRVNLAARLEAACNHFGAETLFCEHTYEMCRDIAGLTWRPIGQISVQGKDEFVRIYELFDDEAEGDLSWTQTFKTGLKYYENKQFSEADKHFREVDASRPNGDEPSQIYLRLCERYAAGTNDAWQPVIRTSK